MARAHTLPLPSPRIWSAVAPEDRLAVCRAFFQDGENDADLRANAQEAIAAGRNLRPQTVRKMPAERQAVLLAGLPALPVRLADHLLVLLHLDHRGRLMKDFLDVLGLANEDGQVAQEAMDAFTLSPELIEPAIARVRSAHPPSQVAVYLHTLLGQDPDKWAALQPHLGPLQPAQAPAPPSSGPPLPAGFTTLDRVLIDCAVECAAEMDGALSPDEVGDLVDEVAHLNKDRVSSYFHRGFCDVLLGRPVTGEFPEVNLTRRRWYFSGVVQGLARRQAWADILRHVGRFPELLDSFREPGEACTQFAAPHIFRALCETGDPAAGARFLTADLAAGLGLETVRALYLHGRELLVQRRDEDALAFLRNAVEALALMAGSGEDVPSPLQHAARRWLAQACLRAGQLEPARRQFASLLEDPEPMGRGEVRAFLGLLECGLRSVMDVRVPATRAEAQSFRERLERGEAIFLRSLEDPPPHGRAEYCLGVLALLRDRVEEARDWLDRARRTVAATPDEYPAAELQRRIQFYLGCALACSARPEHATFACEMLTAGLEGDEDRAGDLLKDALSLLAAAEEDAAVQLAQAVLGTRPQYLDLLLEAGVGKRSPVVRAALRARAETEGRPRRQRYADWQALSLLALAANDPDTAGHALDALEMLAPEIERESELLEFLGDPSHYDPAWKADDARWAKVRLLERLGRLDEAAVHLVDLFHRAVNGNPEDRFEAAQGILERLESYGLGAQPELAARLQVARAAEGAPALPVPHDIAVKVVFVGGDETHARHDAEIREAIRKEFPRVQIVFKHTGWSSNHGKQFDAMQAELQGADCLVLSCFMRTMLGRRLRDLGKPWVACTGKGRPSMERSLRTAIAVAQRRLAGRG